MTGVKRAAVIIISVALLLIICMFAIVEIRMREMRTKISEIDASTAAASAMTKGLDTTLAEYTVNYDDVVDFTYDDSGNIKALAVDIITLNTLGNEIGKNIDSNISEFKSYKSSLPISVLVGEEMTSGLGPKLSYYISMKGSSSTKFSHKFEAAGVNQTRHQIMLCVEISMYVAFGGKVQVVTYNSNVCIAESIIVGTIPQTFANF